MKIEAQMQLIKESIPAAKEDHQAALTLILLQAETMDQLGQDNLRYVKALMDLEEEGFKKDDEIKALKLALCNLQASGIKI